MTDTIHNTIKNYVWEHGKRLTEFPMEFSDGEMKPAYLLSSVSKLFDREYDNHHLEQIGLIRGVNFMVENTADLPDGVPDSNILGAVNGKRTVVSLDGLIKLIMLERNEYGDKIRGWLSEVVVPKALRAYPKLNDHPVLDMLRQDANLMAKEIAELAELETLSNLDRLAVPEIVVSSERKFHPAGPIACGVAGTLGTAYLLRNAYLVSGFRIRKQEANDGKALSFKEKTKLVWKNYLPAAATTVITIAFVVGTNR